MSRESSLRRRRSSLNTLDDNGQPAASGGNRRITVSSIFPSSTSLEASSHHSASLNSLSSGIDYLTHTTPDHHAPLDRNGIISVTKDVQHFLAAVSNLKKALKMEKDSAPGVYFMYMCVCVCVCVYASPHGVTAKSVCWCVYAAEL